MEQASGMASIMIQCPQSMVGKIIGRSGATIQGLQDQTGAKIQIDQQKPEGVPRDIAISGSAASVEMAKGLIDGLLASEGPGMAWHQQDTTTRGHTGSRCWRRPMQLQLPATYSISQTSTSLAVGHANPSTCHNLG